MVFFSAQLTWTMYFAVNLGNHLVFSWFNPRNLHFHNHHVAAKLVFTRVCPPRSDVYWCCCIYLVNSKPLTYAIALNELGSETVHRYVGQEPSGRMFNELILDHNSKSLLFTNPAMTQTTQLTKLNKFHTTIFWWRKRLCHKLQLGHGLLARRHLSAAN